MLQEVTQPQNHTLMDAVVGGLLVATQLGTVWLAHLKGKKGAKTASEGMDSKLANLGSNLRMAIDTRCDALTEDVTAIRADIRTLSSHVIGPDGQNGLRGDVRRIDRELAEIAPRRRKR